MKVLVFVAAVAAMLSVASAATTCVGYSLSFKATDEKWAAANVKSVLTAFIAKYPGSSYSLVKTDLKVTVVAADTTKATAALTTSLAKAQYVTGVTSKPSLCPGVSNVLTCVKLSVTGKAGDYPWLKNEITAAITAYAKANPGKIKSYTITKASGPAPFSYATVTINTFGSTSSLVSFIKSYTAGSKYITKITSAPCTSPTVTPVCIAFIVKAKAGDYKWIENALKTALAGVKYTLTKTTGPGSFTYAKLTITTTSDKVAAIKAKLKPDNFIISFTETTCTSPTVTPVCIAFIVKAKAGDYKWIENALKTALAGVKYTLTKTTGPGSFTYAKLTITTTSDKVAAIKAKLKPDNFIISFTETSCVAPTALCVKLNIKGKAGDYPWLKNEFTALLPGLAKFPGASATIAKATGPAPFSYAVVTLKYSSSTPGVVAYFKALEKSKFVVSIKASSC